MDNYRNFQEATEFIKYTAEAGRGQLIPEACCVLDELYEVKLFKPKDPNCLTAPTTDNSYMNEVQSCAKRFRDCIGLYSRFPHSFSRRAATRR